MSEFITVFHQNQKVAEGTLSDVVKVMKNQTAVSAPILVFSDRTGMRLEINFESDEAHIYAMTMQAYPEFNDNQSPEKIVTIKQRGRPKLGVVAKEITLLPRQWEWLANQSGGASATIRRLVDEAKKIGAVAETQRVKIESAYKFLSEIAGNLPNYEESLRMLFANEKTKFDHLTHAWPKDIRQYAIKLAF